jgi:hypothetical protein
MSSVSSLRYISEDLPVGVLDLDDHPVAAVTEGEERTGGSAEVGGNPVLGTGEAGVIGTDIVPGEVTVLGEVAVGVAHG